MRCNRACRLVPAHDDPVVGMNGEVMGVEQFVDVGREACIAMTFGYILCLCQQQRTVGFVVRDFEGGEVGVYGGHEVVTDQV